MNLSFSRCQLVPCAAVAGIALLLSSTAFAQGEDSPWTFSGDARFRAEFNDNAPGTTDRHRQRMRFRVGGTYRFNDEVLVGVRARTGNPDDPNSPHVDLGDGFNSLEFNLDRLFVEYAPRDTGVTVWAGKFNNPMVRNPVYGELLWDADVQPEGVMARWQTSDCGPFSSAGVMAGEFVTLEQSGGSESFSTMIQGFATMDTGDDSKVIAAVGYFFTGNPSPSGSVALLADNQGNATVGAGAAQRYVSDFGTIDAILGWQTGMLTLSAEMFQNQRAASGVGDTGIAVGGSIGTEAGKFYYQYQTVEQDAMFSAWAGDDFLLTTNMNSHVAGWKRQLASFADLHIWVLMSEPDQTFGGPSDTVTRLRVDLNLHW